MNEELMQEADKLLASLDDSNTVGSLKNEQAARMIRRLQAEVYRQNARANRAEDRIAAAGAYLWERSWSNGVIPKALELLAYAKRLSYTKPRTAVKADEL